ncbi:hypothetical protein GCM10011499_13790 [Pelagibacterium lentulum]|uniref:Uncharacterized protein n=2 Tax=Pelagibacterium lentulum TaxID=2029865 RepID=A0A916VW44_9HYPH|nr:hypothetical protein GCM10011499_13790 [Pelagibacterium lentulum]
MFKLKPDVLVEGVSDKYTVRRIFGGDWPFGVGIFAIDDIEIDCVEVDGVDGCRGRVIAVCGGLYQQSGHVIGLVDRSFEEQTYVPPGDNIILTERADIELDILDSGQFVENLSIYFCKDISDIWIKFALSVARQIHVIRMIGHSDGKSIALPIVAKSISLVGGELFFDRPNFITKIAHKNGDYSYWMNIGNKVDKKMAEATELEPTYYVGFHVLEKVLAAVLGLKTNINKNKFVDDWLGSLLRMKPKENVLIEEPYTKLLLCIGPA